MIFSFSFKSISISFLFLCNSFNNVILFFSNKYLFSSSLVANICSFLPTNKMSSVFFKSVIESSNDNFLFCKTFICNFKSSIFLFKVFFVFSLLFFISSSFFNKSIIDDFFFSRKFISLLNISKFFSNLICSASTCSLFGLKSCFLFISVNCFFRSSIDSFI